METLNEKPTRRGHNVPPLDTNRVEFEAAVVCRILVMEMNISILLKTCHAWSSDGGGIFGLAIISGLGTSVDLRTCINI